MSLKVSSFPLPFKTTQWSLVAQFVADNTFFSLSFLSSTLEICVRHAKFYTFPFIFPFQLILLIFNFCFWSFCKTLICFQFHHSIPIQNVVFSNLVLILLIIIFCVMLNQFFFLISPFNKKIVRISYFSFDPHCFYCFFVFLLNWFFLFNFTIQSKIKFILCFHFDSNSFNLYFFNPFV